MTNDIDKTSPHYKGDFGSIYEVNKKFPTGGVAGDFVVIEGWAHYWNADRATWCVNAERDSYWDGLITNIIEKFKLVRGATYMGVASLGTVPEKVIGAKLYYFATEAGTYKNFGNLVVPQGINVLYSENGSSWVNTTLLEVAQVLGVSTNKVVSQKTLNDALAKKFDKESVVQESGEAEDKVMSQKAVSDKLSDLFINLDNKTLNLSSEINGKYAIELLNGYMDSKGNINGADNESYKHTTKLLVDTNSVYLYTGRYGYGISCPAVLFFDNEDNLVDSIVYSPSETVATDMEVSFEGVRATTKYVVFNSANEPKTPLVIKKKGVTGIYSSISKNTSDIIKLSSDTAKLSNDIYGKEEETLTIELLNGYMDSKGNINGADNESYKHTNYIEIDVSRIYLYTGSYGYGTNCPAVLFFDKDKHIIDSIIAEGHNRVSNLEIDFNSEIRKNTAYVVFNSESQTTYPLSITVKVIRGLTEEIQDTKNSIFNPYREIVYGAIGDSITNGYFADLVSDDEADLKPSNTYPSDPRKNYAYNIKKYFKIKKYYNYGRDGRSIGKDYGFADIAHSNNTDLVTYDKLADDLTHISIWFGWNDANASTKTPIGEIDDNTHTTWCGAWNIVLRELIKKYPHAKILVILPYGVAETYVNAEKEIAKKWGVAYMSVGEVSGEMSFFDINSDKEIDGVNIRTFRRKLFTPDNTHPNTEGYKYLYTRIANKLFSI